MVDEKERERILKFIKAVFQNKDKGSCECPLCGGTIEIGISPYNGHVHGYCAKCGMRMME